MIEQALISGQIGKAIYEEDDRFFVVGVEDCETPRECRPGDASVLFDCGAEFTMISNGRIDVESIKSALGFNTHIHRALFMTLSGLDGELSSESRLLSVEAAEEFLQDEWVRAFVRARLLARPLPTTADIVDALNQAVVSNSPVVSSLYQEVAASQEAIRDLLESWKEVAPEFFDSDQGQAEGEKLLIEIGVFADMVAAIALGRVQNLNSIVVAYGRNPELIKNLHQGTHIINALRTRLLARYTRAAEKHSSVDEVGRDTIAHGTAEIEDAEPGYFDRISDLIAGFETRRRGWKPSKGYEAQPKVDHQIAAIGKLIRQGNKARASEFLHDLMVFHLEHSEKEHVAMSLCSLAKTAIDAHEFESAGELVGYAVMLDIEDVVIGNTRAELLKAMGRFDQALAMYEETMNRFPDYVVTRTGYAEVLKGMGRFEQALTLYEETMNRFPDNVVARNGYAEVLKGMGRFDQALTIYEETMHRFPEDVFARTGYAEVLKAMGRFEQALTLYEETMHRFRDDVVARSGYAEVLKGMGRFEQALAMYEETMHRFPDDVVARSGYAEVLKGMGRFEQALTIYEETMNRFPENSVARSGLASLFMFMDRFEEVRSLLSEKSPISRDDWIDCHILAMTCLKLGDLDEAITRLEYGWKNARWIDVKDYFATGLGVARIKKREFAEAVEVLADNVVSLDIFQKEKRLVLISHSQAELGRIAEATDSLAQIENTHNPHIRNLKDALIRRYNLGQKSEGSFSETEVPALEERIYEEEFAIAA